MHGVRRELVEAQAESLGLPLWTVPLPWPCSNEQYEARMQALCARAIAEGVGAMAFGDLFLTEIRAYREKQLAGSGLEPIFPVWGVPTAEVARTMIGSGLKAKIACIDPKVLDSGFAGLDFDAKMLQKLPVSVDFCGENGEFHTFVYAGPGFRKSIPITVGAVVERDGFVFADLV